jgi:uncharacterized protein YjbJ (UPF0337 family)
VRAAGGNLSGNRGKGSGMDNDELKGRAKEAAGDLTGDKDLQREGKTDQAAGKVKEGVDSAADKAKDLIKES